MDKKLFRSLLLLITFTVGLIFVIVRFDDLWRVCANILSTSLPSFWVRHCLCPQPALRLFPRGL